MNIVSLLQRRKIIFHFLLFACGFTVICKDYLIPFFSMVFSNPSPLMVSTLSTIRRRVNLPELPAGYEPKPGIANTFDHLAWYFRTSRMDDWIYVKCDFFITLLWQIVGIYGLHTPGYYIYALHIRRVPLGFEPHSTFFNDEKVIAEIVVSCVFDEISLILQVEFATENVDSSIILETSNGLR